MRYRKLVPGLLLGLIAPIAFAETAYVTDILRLGLHAAQDTSDRPFQTLVSGSELEIVQRLPNYAEVTTKDGVRGWVKSAYLVDDKPAQLVVAEMQAELETTRLALIAAQDAKLATESELERIVNDADSKIGQVITMEQSIAALTAENESLAARLQSYRGAVPGLWAVTAVAVSLLGGFFLGLWALDAYVRHRHGGFRIY